jgi:hypothetical protein
MIIGGEEINDYWTHETYQLFYRSN